MMIRASIKQYKLYIFDLDNTLYDENSFLKEAYQNIASYLEKLILCHPSKDYYHFLWNTYLSQGRKNLFDVCIEHFELSPFVTIDKFKSILYDTAATASLSLYPWVEGCFKKLLAENKKIAIFTNGHERQQKNKVNNLGLENIHSSLLIYYANLHHCPKPSSEGLKEILQMAGIEASQALMVGDHEVDKICASLAKVDFIDVNDFNKEFVAYAEEL